jgi:hypothetical protein
VATAKPRYSKEEFAQLGDSRYENDVLPRMEPGDEGKFVAIDIETGEYEIDPNDLMALDRLFARLPGAQPWLRRIGSPHARRIGPRPRPGSR